MSFVLDTNVVSELRKPEGRINPGVAAWVAGQQPDALYLSAVTVFELSTGVGRLEARDSRQGRALRTWLENGVLGEFERRILAVDGPVAALAGRLNVVPRQMPDVLIAATARVHG